MSVRIEAGIGRIEAGIEAGIAGRLGRAERGQHSSLKITYTPHPDAPKFRAHLVILLAPMMPHHQGVELQHHPGTRDGREAAHNVVEAVAVRQLLFLVVGSKLGKDLQTYVCTWPLVMCGGRSWQKGSWSGEMKRLLNEVGKNKLYDKTRYYPGPTLIFSSNCMCVGGRTPHA